MDKEEIIRLIKEIIRQQFDEMILNDRFLFKKNIELGEAINIIFSVNAGTKIGTATDQKVGFYGTDPVDQGAAINDPSGGATVDTQARTAINALIDRLKDIGIIA